MGKLKRHNEKRGAIDKKKWQCKSDDKIERVGRGGWMRGWMRGLWK